MLAEANPINNPTSSFISIKNNRLIVLVFFLWLITYKTLTSSRIKENIRLGILVFIPFVA